MNKNLLTFALGITASTIGKKIITSQTAKKISVNAVVSGIKFKDSFDKTIENFKANTDDIIAEAKDIINQEEKEKREEECKENSECCCSNESEKIKDLEF